MDYLPLFADLRQRPVLIIGGDENAARKARLLLRAQAQVRIQSLAPTAEILKLAEEAKITLAHRAFTEDDLDRVDLVIISDQHDPQTPHIARRAKDLGIPINVVDSAELSTVILPGIIDRDPIIIAIGSGGSAPALIGRVRRAIETVLPVKLGDLAKFAGSYRATVAKLIPDPVNRLRFWQAFFQGPIAERILNGKEKTASDAMLRLINQETRMQKQGSVSLVGAGPGDPELLTVKAMNKLQDADVIFYDALVNPRILDYARRDARRIAVGKRKGQHSVPQAKINDLVLKEAQNGHRVVRLKGGDPFIFARSGEELEHLLAAGIETDVVPGITAAVGAAADLGISLTQRGIASAVTLVTGHGQEGYADLNWQALAESGHTLAIYMGVSTAPVIAEQLHRAGLPSAMPVAIVENATLPTKRIFNTCLSDLAATCDTENIKAPAMILIGEVFDQTEIQSRQLWPKPVSALG